MLASLLALALILQPRAAPAEKPDVPPPPRLEKGRLVTDPAWVMKPTRQDVLDVFPEKAARLGVGGLGAVACTIDLEGAPRDCTVSRGEPTGFGFGRAALALVPLMQFKPGTVDGEPTGEGRVNIPIKFDPPDLGDRAFGPDTVLALAPWIAAPTAAQVRAVYPPSAFKAKRGGLGVIRCTVRAGMLTQCRVPGEDPDRFSRAALALAPSFVLGEAFIEVGATSGAILDIPVAFSPTPPPAPPGQTDAPVWAAEPSPELLAASFPVEARQAGVSHIEVANACRVQADGGLGDCVLLAESPAGYGGAQAAARLVNLFRTSAWTREGRSPLGRRVQLPIVLNDVVVAKAPARVAPAGRTPRPASPLKRPARPPV